MRYSRPVYVGPSLLVCPVLEPMYYDYDNEQTHEINKIRKVYLPAGCDWYDYWTSEKYTGGIELEADAPIDKLPLYIRAGSIIPTSQVMQYTDQYPQAPYELLIYSGADADFTIFEDSGDGYGYEQGAYSEYDLHWEDAKKLLTVSVRRGKFNGMCTERELIVLLIGGETKTLTYSGEQCSLSF